MATYGSVRYKRKPKLMPDGWADLRTAGQRIFMVEERTWPALDNTVALGLGTALPGGVTTTWTAAQLAVINASISARTPRGFTISTSATATSGVATLAISGIDQFGVAATETMDCDYASSGTPTYSNYCYQKVTSIVCVNSIVDASAPKKLITLQFSCALGLGCKLGVIGSVINFFSTASTGVETDAVASAVFTRLAAAVTAPTPRVKANGTDYTIMPASYVTTSSYTLWVPCLNDQPENLQVVP